MMVVSLRVPTDTTTACGFRHQPRATCSHLGNWLRQVIFRQARRAKHAEVEVLPGTSPNRCSFGGTIVEQSAGLVAYQASRSGLLRSALILGLCQVVEALRG